MSVNNQPAPTAELDRSDDQVYHNVMEMVKMVMKLKNDVNTLPPSEYVGVVKVGPVLMTHIKSQLQYYLSDPANVLI